MTKRSSSNASGSSNTKKESDLILPSSAKHGLSLLGASMFIVGEIAGTGVLALPDAVSGTGWTGLALIVFVCVVAAFSGIFLGRSWLILEERWPEYREKVRIPFSTIALRAIGPNMATFMTFIMNLQLFGGCVVLLLLCSEMIQALTVSWLSSITFCDWIILVGFVLLPLTFFGSPADFWPVAVVAMSATAISSVLITYSAEAHPAPAPVTYKTPTVHSFLLSVGTMMFSVSGACALPTFQNDMRDKTKFPMACVFGFGLMSVMYLSVSTFGYRSFGHLIESNVVRNLPDDGLTTAINVLMASHVFCAFLIVINPLNLCLEDYFEIEHSFNWRRSGFRTFVVMAIIFVGSSVPRFGKILNFIGASTASLQTFIMPPLFFIYLCRQERLDGWPEHKVSRLTYTVAAVMVVSGTVAGLSATYFSLFDIVNPTAFTPPCYINECRANQH